MIIGVLIFLMIFGTLNYLSSNKQLLSTSDSLLTKQSKLESKFKIDGYTINHPNVIIDPYKSSPLTALIVFETKNNEQPIVTIIGKDKLTTYKKVFPNVKEHYLSIYGLYPDKNNKVIIKFKNYTKTIMIKTAKLPSDFILPTSVLSDKTKLDNELYFYTPSSKGYTSAYDVNGDVRWYLNFNALWNIQRLKNGHLLLSTERLVNSPYYTSGLYEIDLLGKIYNQYNLKGGYHHDYFEMPNGNLIVASDNFQKLGTVEDYVVVLDRQTGKVIKSFDLKNIIKSSDGKSGNWVGYDWFHNNAVWYDQTTNSIILSGRHDDAVISINYDTGKLNWILGDPTNWSKDYQKYFFKPIGNNFEWQYGQHGAMLTPEGYVFLFDNGDFRSKIPANYLAAKDNYSRGVIYKIDTSNMTIKQLWSYGKNRGSNFYSPYIGNVQYLDKGHYIVHSGGISYKNGQILNVPASLGQADTLKDDMVELLNNKVIFEMVLPTNNYRVRKMNLYAGDNFSLGEAKIKGSLGETAVLNSRIGFILNSKTIDKKYNSYNITLKKEEDRLSVSGQFTGDDKASVYLYKNGISKIYDIQISQRPYTAMCVDVFNSSTANSNKINATKYINKDGLRGNYSIYIEINGALYNTKKFINF